jgi:hypothetical protein
MLAGTGFSLIAVDVGVHRNRLPLPGRASRTVSITGQHQTVEKDSIAIPVTGDNVTTSIGAASLTLARCQRLRAVPFSERELLLTELRCTDLVGHDAELMSL